MKTITKSNIWFRIEALEINLNFKDKRYFDITNVALEDGPEIGGFSEQKYNRNLNIIRYFLFKYY